MRSGNCPRYPIGARASAVPSQSENRGAYMLARLGSDPLLRWRVRERYLDLDARLLTEVEQKFLNEVGLRSPFALGRDFKRPLELRCHPKADRNSLADG